MKRLLLRDIAIRFLKLTKVIIVILLPLVLLLRGAIYLHVKFDLSPWLCIAGGMLFSSLILFLYLSYFYSNLGGKFNRRSIQWKLLLSFLISGVYVIHGIFFLAVNKMPNEIMEKEIREVHPVMRLSIATLFQMDDQLNIIDASRLPSDYSQMGQKSRSFSLHFIQSNGYAHALDITTIGRGELRNSLVKLYFKLLGFNTLRHSVSGPSGDHLHISLMSHDRPHFY